MFVLKTNSCALRLKMENYAETKQSLESKTEGVIMSLKCQTGWETSEKIVVKSCVNITLKKRFRLSINIKTLALNVKNGGAYSDKKSGMNRGVSTGQAGSWVPTNQEAPDNNQKCLSYNNVQQYLSSLLIFSQDFTLLQVPEFCLFLSHQSIL